MADPAEGDVYQITIHLSDTTDAKLENTYFYQQQSAAGPTDPFSIAVDLATAFWSAVGTAYKGLLIDLIYVNAISCRRVSNGGGPTAVVVVNEPGNNDNNMSTVATALNLAFIPAKSPYREGHTYIAGFPDSWLQNDQIQAAALTAVEAFETAIGSVVTAAATTFIGVIYDKITEESRAIIATVLRALVTPLKRRLKRRGDKKHTSP